mmetsp:Transcript_79849/g.200938  ORF Transcript_79849/g.200938 Transcript_79849/m.200938 type:complete len:89 (-) Transcript_79849:2508-2774(-)
MISRRGVPQRLRLPLSETAVVGIITGTGVATVAAAAVAVTTGGPTGMLTGWPCDTAGCIEPARDAALNEPARSDRGECGPLRVGLMLR